ncbi:Eukaryotic translation initiation factor 2 subunit beta [Auxenochlorella protothecoides]|uniref:Eukaryotic translation initiation factor 2 subunit beta n=1 Tax=Auxenochlorella protothecoides TaxID=3075 RepID=A0A087SKL7_AUXPR|nr:Eukaryotic translation initiation factor 2 subunit beta [Auxenochlorella protothecoides]KFM26271.1 Eukaryotic translation initiation factor 2 subunit beta [Auxenochlorella protothecoides]
MAVSGRVRLLLTFPYICFPLESAVNDDLNLEFGKKKKKKTVKIKEELVDEAEALEEDDLDLSMELGKKKKKKKAKAKDEDFGLEAAEGPESVEGSQAKAGLPWDGSDRDYTYEELLDRVFGILKENNPELTGERRRTTLKPPQVAREGTKKTVFTNFMELCKSMNRNHEHVQAFLLAELGTSGSLDGQQRLIVKGRFLPKAFEGVLRRYINEYVLCNSCKSPDTLLDRDASTRIMFMRCQQCGASRTVSAIKAGFQARTVSRKSQLRG